MSRTGKVLRVGLGLVIGGVFLVLAFRSLDWNDVWSNLRRLDPRWLATGVFALALAYVVRTIRWWLMLAALRPGVRLTTCFGPFVGSFALNNVLPLRAGDFVRAFAFRKRLGIGGGGVLGTLLVERVLDLLALLGFFFVGLMLAPPGALPRPFVVGASALAGGALAALAITLLFHGAIERWLERTVNGRLVSSSAIAKKLGAGALSVFRTLHLIRSAAMLGRLLGLSVLAWGLEGGLFGAVAMALQVGTPPAAPWFALATGNLATLIPGTPGHAGTFDYFAIQGLMAFGAPREQAAIFALLVHALLWGLVTLAGFTLLWATVGLGVLRRQPEAGVDQLRTSTPNAA